MAWGLILRFIAQFGLRAASKKFGKNAIKEIVKKSVKKPKSKIVKHKKELQRVKEQIARDLPKVKVKKERIPKGMYKLVTAKDGMKVWVKQKPIGYVSRNFGKKVPYYTKSKSVKGSARWVAEQKKIKEGIAYLNATRGPGHTLKDLKIVIAQTKKRIKPKPKKPKGKK